jgi:hypothetical protein
MTDVGAIRLEMASLCHTTLPPILKTLDHSLLIHTNRIRRKSNIVTFLLVYHIQ